MKVELFEKVKLAVMAVVGAFTAAFGVVGWMCVVFAVVMSLDYITGTVAAQKNGDWSSAVARGGLWHKGGMIAVVMVAGLADFVLGMVANSVTLGNLQITYTVLLLPLVLAWYIVTELGSILENAARMGANVPQWLLNMLAQTKQRIEAAGEQAAQSQGDGEAAGESAAHVQSEDGGVG